MFSPPTPTHLLTWTLSDPLKNCPCWFVFQPNISFPSASFGVAGCKTKGKCRDEHASWWMHSNSILADCPTWLPAQLCECVLTSTLTGTPFSNSCFQRYPPFNRHKETDNWPQSQYSWISNPEKIRNWRQNCPVRYWMQWTIGSVVMSCCSNVFARCLIRELADV